MSESALDDSSDDENVNYMIASGILPGFDPAIVNQMASQPGKSENTKRDFQEGYHRLWNDYFCDTPKYGSRDFERRFRVPKSVFFKVYNAIHGKDIFVQRRDAAKKNGIHPLVRMTAALRIVAYGIAADAIDEYLQVSQDSVILSMKTFSKLCVEKFSAEYLGAPTEADLERIISINTISWPLGIHRLSTLGLEKLSSSLGRPVQGEGKVFYFGLGSHCRW